jgi:glycosyltransferase involved in cell wall biosynthesis
MSPVRVAYVIATVGTTAGGTGRHVAMLAEGGAARGLAVSVLGPAAARGLFPGADFAPVEIAERPHPARDAAAVLRLRRLLRRAAPDVVHAHGLRAGAAAALALTRLPGGRSPGGRSSGGRLPGGRSSGAAARRPALLVTVHNAPPSAAAARAVYLALERLTAWRADAVLCVSPDLADRMRRAGARDVALAVVAAPPPVPPSAEAIEKARADIGAAGRPVVLAAGRCAPQKGFDVLLEAMIAMPARDPAPLLVIAGEGPAAGSLAARAREAGTEVRFLGPRRDVPALLAVADVVAVPSRWEGQPLIAAEALHAGRAVVASRVGGVPALTGDEGALLVPPEDPVRLAAAVRAVLDDPELAARLRAAATARAATLPAPRDAIDAAIAAYARLTARPAAP